MALAALALVVFGAYDSYPAKPRNIPTSHPSKVRLYSLPHGLNPKLKLDQFLCRVAIKSLVNGRADFAFLSKNRRVTQAIQ